MKVGLNSRERRDWDIMLETINNFKSGRKFFFSDTIPQGRSATSRLAIRLFQDVRDGLIPNVSLAGIRSCDGYIKG